MARKLTPKMNEEVKVNEEAEVVDVAEVEVVISEDEDTAELPEDEELDVAEDIVIEDQEEKEEPTEYNVGIPALDKKMDVSIDAEALKVVVPEPVAPKNERVRMRVKHACNIGGEFYEFEAGQCYNVPGNVKRILNKAGKLSPL